VDPDSGTNITTGTIHRGGSIPQPPHFIKHWLAKRGLVLDTHCPSFCSVLLLAHRKLPSIGGIVEGQTVSHYRILEKIGEGGMGQVYLAEDTSLERKVALKFLPEYLQQDETAHKRFIREAKSAAAIDHPFICNIFEVAQTDDGQDFIVMEYVEGQTLKDSLEQGRIPG